MPSTSCRSASNPILPALAAWCATLSLGGCLGVPAPPPPISEHTPSGIVRAHSTATTRQVAGWLEQLVPGVSTRLPATRSVVPEVWVQRGLRLHENHHPPEWVDGFTTSAPDRIHLREDAEELEAILCHELVHLVLDDSWSALPTVIEEGLCERIAMELTSSEDALYFASKRMVAAVYLGSGDLLLARRFDLPGGSVMSSDVLLRMRVEMQPESASPLESLELAGGYADIRGGRIGAEHYGFGAWLVDRIVDNIGYRGLHDLCVQAQARGEELIAVDRLLAAARLPRDPEAWRPILARSFTEADLSAVAERFRPAIVESVTSFLQSEINGKPLADYPRSGFSLRLGFPGGRRLELVGDGWWRPEPGQ